MKYPLTNEHLKQFIALTMLIGMSDVLTESAMVNMIVDVDDISPQNNFQPSSVIGRSISLQVAASNSVPHRKSGHVKSASIPGTAVLLTAKFTGSEHRVF